MVIPAAQLLILLLLLILLMLLFGRGLATYIISAISTETIRMPLTISTFTQARAVLVVMSAAVCSFWVVGRMLRKLDLVGVLKARD